MLFCCFRGVFDASIVDFSIDFPNLHQISYLFSDRASNFGTRDYFSCILNVSQLIFGGVVRLCPDRTIGPTLIAKFRVQKDVLLVYYLFLLCFYVFLFLFVVFVYPALLCIHCSLCVVILLVVMCIFYVCFLVLLFSFFQNTKYYLCCSCLFFCKSNMFLLFVFYSFHVSCFYVFCGIFVIYVFEKICFY